LNEPNIREPLSLQVLDRFNIGEEALVPAFWSVEVLNSLLVGEKRGRITPAQTRAFLANLPALQPKVDHASMEQIFGTVQSLCRDHGLTPYDAFYVELAWRTKYPLATLDESQKDAANALSVECL
jgi:predicted nucleic acid-binding protein